MYPDESKNISVFQLIKLIIRMKFSIDYTDNKNKDLDQLLKQIITDIQPSWRYRNS
jgi:hypothetical protein